MRNCDGSCGNGDLHEWHIDEEEAEQELKQKGDIAPEVVKAVLREREEPSPADDLISNLKNDGSDEVGSLCIEKCFGCVANLLVCIRGNAVELWDGRVIRSPPALTPAGSCQTIIEEADVDTRLICETPADDA